MEKIKNEYRNVAVCGVTPEIMDYGKCDKNFSKDASMLEKLLATTNVIQVDPSRRTVDLGKWNVMVNTKNYEAAVAEIDTIINDTTLLTPSIIMEKKKFNDFSFPTRLDKPPKRNQSQVSKEYRNWILKDYANNTPLIVSQSPPHTIEINSITYSQATKTGTRKQRTIIQTSNLSMVSNQSKTSKLSQTTTPSIQEMINVSLKNV